MAASRSPSPGQAGVNKSPHNYLEWVSAKAGERQWIEYIKNYSLTVKPATHNGLIRVRFSVILNVYQSGGMVDTTHLKWVAI
jgi:hypothetical protein